MKYRATIECGNEIRWPKTFEADNDEEAQKIAKNWLFHLDEQVKSGIITWENGGLHQPPFNLIRLERLKEIVTQEHFESIPLQ